MPAKRKRSPKEKVYTFTARELIGVFMLFELIRAVRQMQLPPESSPKPRRTLRVIKGGKRGSNA